MDITNTDTGSGFVTEPDNTGSGFVTDNGGSGFVTEPQPQPMEGSGFVTDSEQVAGSGFVTAPEPSAGSGFVTAPSSAPTSAPAQKTSTGISSTFSDIQVLSSQGAMSTVYKGKKYGKWHIIKRIKPEFKNNPQYRDLFLKEFDNGIQLDHPNIVRLEDKGEDEEGLWYTMEYVDGRSLDQMIKNHELRSDSIKKSLLMQLCDALSYVHKKQIVHRDLKPENILVTYRGDNAKVLDFGLAYSDSYDDHMKSVGTPRYQAPEQKTKGNMVDQRADIYALGLILLEMCTGDITDREAKTVDNPNFWTIIRKATKEDPTDRYYNCQEILDDLGRNIVKLQEPDPEPVAPVAAPPSAPEPKPATVPEPKPEPAKAEAPKPTGVNPPQPQPAKTVDLKDEKKGSKTGMIIGIAAAVVIIGVVAFLLLGNGGDKPAEQQPTAQNEQAAPEQKPDGQGGKIQEQPKEKSEADKLMEKADKLFNDDKNIARARDTYEQVLALEPGHSKAKDMLNSCQKIMDGTKIGDLTPKLGDNGKYGFADNQGYILIDFDYDNAKPNMPGANKGLYGISKNGKIGVFNDKTKRPETDFIYNKMTWVRDGKWRLMKNPVGQVQDYISVDANGKVTFEENKM